PASGGANRINERLGELSRVGPSVGGILASKSKELSEDGVFGEVLPKDLAGKTMDQSVYRSIRDQVLKRTGGRQTPSSIGRIAASASPSQQLQAMYPRLPGLLAGFGMLLLQQEPAGVEALRA